MACRTLLYLAIIAGAAPLAGALAQEQSEGTSLGDRLGRLGRSLFQRPENDEQDYQPPTRGQRMNAQRGFSPNQLNRGGQERPAPRMADEPRGRLTEKSSPTTSSRRTAQPGYARDPMANESGDKPATRMASRPLATKGRGAGLQPQTTVPDVNAKPATEESVPSESLSEAEETTTAESETAETPIEEPQPNARRVESRQRAGSIENRLREARRMAPPVAAEEPAEQPEASNENAPAASDMPVDEATETNQLVDENLPSEPPASEEPINAPSRVNETHSQPPVASPAARPNVAVSTPGVAPSDVANQAILNQETPVLQLETIGPPKIKVGVAATYTVKIRNRGSLEAKDVVVSVKVPEGADIADTRPSDGIAQPGVGPDGSATIEWRLGRLPGQSRAELAMRIIPRKSRPFDLAVQWTQAPVLTQTQVEVQEAKLLMNLSGPDEVFYGERELFKLTLSNPGNGDADNVIVKLMPTTPGEDQPVSHEIGLLRAGENKVVELELTARQIGTLRLKAEAVADGGLQALIDEEILVRRADLKVAVQGPQLLYAGTAGTYKIVVSNPGNAVAKNVQIAAMLPAGASFVSCTEGGVFSQEQARITWSTTSLRPGTEWACSFKCDMANPGANTTQVVSVAEGDLRNTASLNTVVEALADLTLEVKDPQGPVPVGQDAVYEIHVRNRGTKSADGVEVVAFFSEGIEPTEVEGGPHQISPGQIALAPIASLGPGHEMIYKIKAKASKSGNHVFRAEVQCAALDTKLAAEETTRFYGEAAETTSTSETDADNPAPVGEQSDSLEPTPDGQ